MSDEYHYRTSGSSCSRIEICKVKTFDHNDPEITLQLLITSSRRPTASLLKTKLAEVLKLRISSATLFGIFRGPLGNPKELLLDSHSVPNNCQDLTFQRLSFDRDDEIRVTKEDPRALKLLFWEAAHAFRHGKILPKLHPSTVDTLNKHLLQSNTISPPPLQAMLAFMSTIHSIPHYFWSLYYKADYCMLQNPISYRGHKILEGTEVHVSVSIEELMILDSSGKEELASWFWDEVHLMRLQRNKSPQPFITFEVINEDKDLGKDVFDNVIISTDQSEYLYSLVVHILKVLEERYLSRENLTSGIGHSKELLNMGFRKKLLPAKPKFDLSTYQEEADEAEAMPCKPKSDLCTYQGEADEAEPMPCKPKSDFCTYQGEADEAEPMPQTD